MALIKIASDDESVEADIQRLSVLNKEALLLGNKVRQLWINIATEVQARCSRNVTVEIKQLQKEEDYLRYLQRIIFKLEKRINKKQSKDEK